MKRFSTNHYRTPFLFTFLLITVFFAWTFAAAPFSEMTNSFVLNGGTTLSALIAAIIFSLIPFYFQRGEPPRTIWTFFAICLWLWTIAEAMGVSVHSDISTRPGRRIITPAVNARQLIARCRGGP